MSKIIENLETALNNNEFREFLKGNGIYKMPNRESEFTDFSVALSSAIYPYYRLYPEKKINTLFEQEIIDMMDGDDFEIMCAFEYVWRQIVCEERKTAPFNLNKQCFIKMQQTINERKEILKKYKEYYDFGSNLDDGAYQYAENIDKMLEDEYGRRIL